MVPYYIECNSMMQYNVMTALYSMLQHVAKQCNIVQYLCSIIQHNLVYCIDYSIWYKLAFYGVKEQYGTVMYSVVQHGAL